MFLSGKDRPLFASSALPDVSSSLDGWMQPITLTQITKSVVNYVLKEVETQIAGEGVWQPMGARTLSMKPEGQRAWRWYTLHTKTAIGLKPDDIVIYLGKRYRVKSDTDYSLYGYYQYELVEDWEVSP